MDSKFKVITLCGSTRFKEDYIRGHKELTLAGNIVISVGLFGHQGDDEVWEEGVKEMFMAISGRARNEKSPTPRLVAKRCGRSFLFRKMSMRTNLC